MKIVKSERTGTGNYLKVGVFEGRIDGINQTSEQYCKWLGIDKADDAKETEYLGEKDGDTKLTIAFAISDVASDFKTTYRINITDKVAKSKSDKTQWVNARGMSNYVDDEKNLQDWFTTAKDKEGKKIGDIPYRKAKVGEAQLYEFMRNWLSKVDFFSQDVDILLDMKKLFRGNVSEIADLLKASEEENVTGTIVMPAVVYIKDAEDGGEPKKYQNIAPFFLPGYKMKNLRNLFSNGAWGSSDKQIARWKAQIEDQEYGIRDQFILGPLVEFDAEACLAATNEAIKHDTSAAPEDTSY